MKNLLAGFILVLFFFLCGCTKTIPRQSLVTVIGIDKSGSFLLRDKELKKNLISSIVYKIVKEKAEFQNKDKFWPIKRWLGGINEEKYERVIIAPISFRGKGGISQFLIFNDDPVSISKDGNFTPEKLKSLIFPQNEPPAQYTNYLQFFEEINSVLSIYNDIRKIKVNYILITDGLPDPTGKEGINTPELTSDQIIARYGQEYREKLRTILPENVKISFIGVDAHILEFWNYVLSIERNKKIEIQYIASTLEQISDEKIKEFSNPYNW